MRSTDTVLDRFTASFGIAFAQAGDDPEGLLIRADEQLYKAKHNGRNQVQPALTAMSATA
ncbi:MAG: diguanylate cyclase [Pseudomonas sp.]|jgi:diguanylate cyclase